MNFRRRYLSFLYLKYLLFVPLFLLYLIIPLVIRFQLDSSGGVTGALPKVASTLEDYLPLLSVWWIVFQLRESVEGDGREVFYTYESIYRTKFWDVVTTALVYMVCLIPLYIWLLLTFSGQENALALDFAKNVILCIFYTGFVYALIYTLRSTLFPLMFALLFYAVFKVIGGGTLDAVSIYMGENLVSPEILLTKYMIILAVGIAFYAIGYLQNRRFTIK